MVDSKAQQEPSGIERFSHLEDKIYRVVEAFKTIRKENEALRAEITRLKANLENLQARETSFNENMATLQKEREELRERVEKALSLLATLETK
jgi:chromosome segregation ATPase